MILRTPVRGLVFCLGILSTCALPARGDIRLPVIFGDHAVLQRDERVPVWGWAAPGEQIRVQLDQEQPVATEADARGRWRVDLPPHKAGGPHTLVIQGKNTLKRTDLWFGEVWLCSGQSNMAFTVNRALNYEEERAKANYPRIRHITIPREFSPVPTEDVPSCEWQVCSPETVGGFSAVAYFFGRELHSRLKVPVGLINSSWGGTRIEPWTPLCGFEQVPTLAHIVNQIRLQMPDTSEHKERLTAYLASLEGWLKQARDALGKKVAVAPPPAFPKELLPFNNHQQPAVLYNRMIHGLVPFGIRGTIWYQGESNHRDGMLYVDKMKALIQGWRTVWKKSDLPFYFVQIAPYQYGNEAPDVLPLFWEAQSAAARLPHTGMVVINDVGNIHDIHPRNKQAVGKRLALQALARTYGFGDIVWSGPTFDHMKIEGSAIRIYFKHVGSGLASRDGKPLTWFELYDPETEEFVPADARIDGDTVVVSNPKISRPVAVRFAWHKIAEPNLMNKEGLPAAPFRAGSIPRIDCLPKAVPEAKDFQLVYDLDLHNIGRHIRYDVDRHSAVKGPFDRIAYFLELKQKGKKTQYVWVAMDPFTQDPAKIGIPTPESKAHFQTRVRNMTVISNVPGLVTGTGLSGNIEFWPNNYGPANSAHVPNASDAVWDFGDQPGPPVDGYGCMQVHNYQAKQTIFAINTWKGGSRADIGIGNSPPKPTIPGGRAELVKRTRDWTFQNNAGMYTHKRLRVFVRPKR